jgi:hypothetical protein
LRRFYHEALWGRSSAASAAPPGNLGLGAVASYKPLFGLTILFSIVLLFVYSAIHEEHQPRRVGKISKSTGTFVTKMSMLAVLDNFGAGMAGALIPYWFFLQLRVELKSLAIIFFASFFSPRCRFLAHRCSRAKLAW